MGRAQRRRDYRAAKAALPSDVKAGMRAEAGRKRSWMDRRVLDPDTADEREGVAAQRAAAVRESADRLARLVESIPPELRDAPQTRTMLMRVASTWETPVHPDVARRWREEWEAFVAEQREARIEHAAHTGLWVPGR